MSESLDRPPSTESCCRIIHLTGGGTRSHKRLSDARNKSCSGYGDSSEVQEGMGFGDRFSFGLDIASSWYVLISITICLGLKLCGCESCG